MIKERLSNFELLRIIAIVFILVDHVLMVTNSLPSASDIISDATGSISKIFFSVLAIGGVDIFVLISGWFGIHVSRKGLGKYIYEVCFLLWLLLAAFAVAAPSQITVDSLRASLGLYNGYWFIMAYLGLYILSPILNAFVDNVSQRQFGAVLLCLYLFQCYFSWVSNFVDYYSGYSITLFCTLYLTSRYVRLYPIKILSGHPVIAYAAIIFFMTVMTALGLRFTGTALRMLRYDNPLVIASSLCLLLTFDRWKCKSRIINRLAMSCFAVYIIHFNPLVFPYFTKGVMSLWMITNGIAAVAAIFVYLCIIVLACFVVDQLRIVTWNILMKQPKIFNH